MKNVITKSDSSQPVGETAVYLFDDWFDPIEAGVRDRVRGFIQGMIEGELDETLMRPRYGRRLASSSGKDDGLAAITGHRHGHRSRSLTGSFGRTEIAVPRARLVGADGKTTEWKSKVLRTYQRRTLVADALIASAYLAGTNTRRVRRALKALFAEGIGKDVVSRVWRRVKSDWDAWNARSLAEEPIVRLILDGTVVRAQRRAVDGTPIMAWHDLIGQLGTLTINEVALPLGERRTVQMLARPTALQEQAFALLGVPPPRVQ